MSKVVIFPKTGRVVIEVAEAWVHEPGRPESGGERLVVVVWDVDGRDRCVWAGEDPEEALRQSTIWQELYPGSHVLISCDLDGDPDGPDGGERLAA